MVEIWSYTMKRKETTTPVIIYRDAVEKYNHVKIKGLDRNRWLTQKRGGKDCKGYHR